MEMPFSAYQGEEPYIFVSYAHEDAAVVYPEIQWLKDQGFNIWYDEGIAPGHEWRDELAERIVASSLFLYFVTPQSVVSEHCRREVNYAIDHGAQLIAVHLEETELPGGLDLSLNSAQAILRHELADLDYRIKLLKGAGTHLERGIGALTAPATSGYPTKVLVGTAIITLVIGATLAAFVMIFRQPAQQVAIAPPTSPIKRFELHPPHYEGHSSVRITSNGQRIAYVGRAPEGQQIYTRVLSESDVQPVPGTLGVESFWFSPDGESVIFRVAQIVKKVRLDGGAIVTLANPVAIRGYTWGPGDTIVTTVPSHPGLTWVSVTGEKPEVLTTPLEGHTHWVPMVLPGGNAVVFSDFNGEADAYQAGFHLTIVDLDSRQVRDLGISGVMREVTRNHLLFNRGRDLWVVPFDPERRELTGDAVMVLADINTNSVDVSDDGTLIYNQSLTIGSQTLADLVWVDRDGREMPVGAETGQYIAASLSPDEERIAVLIGSQSLHDIWIYSTARDTLTRLTFDEDAEGYPVWNPDGTRLAYTKTRSGLFVQRADGSGQAELIGPSSTPVSAWRWSTDDRHWIMQACEDGSICEPWEMTIDGNAVTEKPLWDTEYDVRGPMLSADGKWIAYRSTASGRSEVYIRPYPDVNRGRWQVSTEGGVIPIWSPQGDEFFYIDLQYQLKSVSVETGASITLGKPVTLFDVSDYYLNYGFNITSAADRFLFVKFKEKSQDVPIVIVQNFLDELARLAPTKH